MYSARIRYPYDVDGEIYYSEGVGYKDLEMSLRKEADRILEQYPVGRKVEVYFNPEIPQDAVLELGATWVEHTFFAVGGVLTAFSLFRWLF